MLIVDTYNVLHAAPRVDPGFAGLTLPALVRLLQASRFQSDTILVCDGTGTRTGIDESFLHPDSPIRVTFAGPGKDADAAIARLVIEEERKGRAGSVTVVSSDKGVLASAIGPFGPKARRMTSEQFVRTILDDAARSSSLGGKPVDAPRPTLDAESAKRWLREFGIDPDARPPVPAINNSSPPANTNAPEGPLHAERGGTRNQQPGSENRGTKQDWPDGINPDDLDMRKWLKE